MFEKPASREAGFFLGYWVVTDFSSGRGAGYGGR
jgi:hypothetical protein